MPDNGQNNADVDSLDFSMEDLHNPNEPLSTGNPPTNTPVPPVPPAQPNPGANPTPKDEGNDVVGKQDDDNGDNGGNDYVATIKSVDDLKALLANKTAENMTQDESDELSDIVDAFGASSFNTNGELLDADNKVLFSSDQIKAYLETGEIPVDENGDFVTADGEIIKTKVELYRANTTVGTVMNALSKNFNVGFNDNFLPDDTEESVVNVVSKVVDVVRNTAVQNYFTANPELESFRKHLILNGTPDGYNATAVNYDTVIIKDLSKEQKKAYITEAARVIGKPLTTNYLAYLDSLKDEDYNLEVAQNLTVLKENQEKRKSELDTQLSQRKADEEKELEHYWNTITNTVKNGKISNINIPIPERESFLSYLTTPVKDGKSKDILDAESDDAEFDLMMSYFRFKNKDISQLAKNIAHTAKVQTMRDRLSQNKPRNFNGDKGQKPRTQNDYIPGLGEIRF